MAKTVQIDAYIEWPAGTVRSSQFSKFDFAAKRAKVDSSVYGNKVDQTTPGTYSNELSVTIRPDADKVFLRVLLGQVAAGTDFAVLYRESSASIDLDNPQFDFSVCPTDTPPLAVGRGELLAGDITYTINSAIVYTDGTNTITLG